METRNCTYRYHCGEHRVRGAAQSSAARIREPYHRQNGDPFTGKKMFTLSALSTMHRRMSSMHCRGRSDGLRESRQRPQSIPMYKHLRNGEIYMTHEEKNHRAPEDGAEAVGEELNWFSLQQKIQEAVERLRLRARTAAQAVYGNRSISAGLDRVHQPLQMTATQVSAGHVCRALPAHEKLSRSSSLRGGYELDSAPLCCRVRRPLFSYG